jgi:hypothetical protein
VPDDDVISGRYRPPTWTKLWLGVMLAFVVVTCLGGNVGLILTALLVTLGPAHRVWYYTRHPAKPWGSST